MTALPIKLRPARLADLEAIIALDRATELAPHWPVAAYAAILDATPAAPKHAPHRCLILAERIAADESQPINPLAGFAVGLVHPAPAAEQAEPRSAELEDVVVAADCRRTGIGRSLCTALLAWCHAQGVTEIALEVRAANAGAIALYTQLGFEQVGRRPSYYSNPQDDALAMILRWPTASS